jgi:hypothetical protein
MDNPTTATGERPISKPKQQIVNEAKRIEESLLYSSKGHYAAARFWSNFHLWIGIPMVIITAIAGATAFKTFDSNGVLAGICALIGVVLSSLMTFLNPNEKESQHRIAGHNYDSLMSTVRLFWSVECWRAEDEAILADRLTQLSEQKSKLNQACPQIPTFAYEKAKEGIAAGEGVYAVDKDKPETP